MPEICGCEWGRVGEARICLRVKGHPGKHVYVPLAEAEMLFPQLRHRRPDPDDPDADVEAQLQWAGAGAMKAQREALGYCTDGKEATDAGPPYAEVMQALRGEQ